MTFNGVVSNGTIILDSDAHLPEGTRVEVQVADTAKLLSPLGEMLMKHAGKAEGLPEDAASQHDHYLYGTPKK